LTKPSAAPAAGASGLSSTSRLADAVMSWPSIFVAPSKIPTPCPSRPPLSIALPASTADTS
jgi:hypothetical protein